MPRLIRGNIAHIVNHNTIELAVLLFLMLSTTSVLQQSEHKCRQMLSCGERPGHKVVCLYDEGEKVGVWVINIVPGLPIILC